MSLEHWSSYDQTHSIQPIPAVRRHLAGADRHPAICRPKIRKSSDRIYCPNPYTSSPPPPPPSDNGGGGGGGGSAPAAPTETPIPSATPTATAIPVTLAATPVGGYIEPEACGRVTYESTFGTTNVRVQPNPESDIVGSLVFLEIRYVVGRAADGEWWYVELADGSVGWAADVVGTVRGNIATLPLLDGDGNPQESGSWNPTPNPDCPTPEPTSTPEPSPTLAPTETATATATVVEEIVEAEEIAQVLPTETRPPTEVPPTVGPTNTPQPTPTAISEVVPDSGAAGGFNWLLFGGIGLLAIGTGVYLFRGGSNSNEEGDT